MSGQGTDVIDSIAQSKFRVSTAGLVRSKGAPYLASALGYVLLAALAFPSIILNFSTAIPGIKGGSPDFALFYWDLWWFQQAVFRLGQNPFFTNYILFPHTLNLAYHSLAPFFGLLAVPLQMFTSWTTTVNFLLFGSLVFSAVALFAFLRHHAVPHGLAFVGGALYVFNSFMTMRVTFLHLNMLPIGWLPLSLLATDWLVEQRTWKAALVLSLIVYAAALTDLQYAIWLPLIAVPYFFYRLVQGAAASRRRIIALSALAAAVLLGLLLIAPLPQWLAGRSASFPVATLRDAQVRSMQLTDIIASPPRFAYGEVGTLGLLLPLGVITGLIMGRGERDRFFWLMMGLLGLILAMGPTLQPIGLPLPYQVIHFITGGFFRVPARFILIAILGFIIFATYSLRTFYARLSRVWRASFFIGVIVFLAIENQWYTPFPTFSMPDYRIYHQIGQDPAEYLVLEIPVGPDNAIADKFGRGTELQYYATIHHKRVINGTVSRAPAGTTNDYRQWPLMTAWAGEGPLPDRAAAQAELQRLAPAWDMRYIIVHRDMLSPELANWTIELLNSHPAWCFADEEGDVIAYQRVEKAACSPDLLSLPAGGAIKLGENADRYLGPGWYPPENVGGPQARWTGGEESASLRVKLAPRDYRVSLNAASFLPDQKVAIFANDHHLADLSIQPGWAEVQFDLPASVIPADGLVMLKFVHTLARSAYEQTGGQSEDHRPLAVAYESIQFAPP